MTTNSAQPIRNSAEPLTPPAVSTTPQQNRALTPSWKLKSGDLVIDRQRSHLHEGVIPILDEVLPKIASQGRAFFSATIDLGRIVGETTCLETNEGDDIIFAQRPGRVGLTRFVKNRQAEATSLVTVILKKIGFQKYLLITAWLGGKAEPEPWDRNATPRSADFWRRHALLWGSEPVLPNTEATSWNSASFQRVLPRP
jgi:hypothetical protein